MKDIWSQTDLVFVRLPPPARCPACGGTAHIIVRSENQGDGSLLRKSICRKCSTRFRVVAEPPELEMNDDCQSWQ